MTSPLDELHANPLDKLDNLKVLVAGTYGHVQDFQRAAEKYADQDRYLTFAFEDALNGLSEAGRRLGKLKEIKDDKST